MAWSFLLVAALLLLLPGCHGGGSSERVLSVVRRGPWQHDIVEGVHPQAAVTGKFTNHINETGYVDDTVGIMSCGTLECAYWLLPSSLVC